MMSRVFTGTVAKHFQLDIQTLGHAYRVDVETLLPFAAVFGTLLQGDLSGEFDHITDL